MHRHTVGVLARAFRVTGPEHSAVAGVRVLMEDAGARYRHVSPAPARLGLAP